MIFYSSFFSVYKEVDMPDGTIAYSFSWKPDFSMLLVGTKTCSIIVYSTDLTIIATHYFQHRLRDICWHPNASQSDLNVPYCYQFAAVSNTKNVIVCDFKSDVKGSDSIVAKYDLSEEMINWIAWNPYEPNELVISNDEGLAQVKYLIFINVHGYL